MKGWYFYRSWLIQMVPLILLGGLVVWFIHNAAHNLAARGIVSGFGFLDKTAGFTLSETFISTHQETYGGIIVAGILNTLHVSGIAIILATILGLLFALARLSSIAVLSTMATLTVTGIRNIPLLLQLFLWYGILVQGLPHLQEAWHIGHLYVSNRGIYIPSFTDIPIMGTFNIEGGWRLTPEFLAVLLGLSLYSASFIAEIFRSGIESVPKGQWEAALALGLTPYQTMRYSIWPQGLRLAIPPLTSQYLSMVKNSSLAIAIGYPDVVGVTNVVINHSGQAIEGIVLIATVYLIISICISFILRRFERHV
jgi:general L-amino acid transport system permease protein